MNKLLFKLKGILLEKSGGTIVVQTPRFDTPPMDPTVNRLMDENLIVSKTKTAFKDLKKGSVVSVMGVIDPAGDGMLVADPASVKEEPDDGQYLNVGLIVGKLRHAFRAFAGDASRGALGFTRVTVGDKGEIVRVSALDPGVIGDMKGKLANPGTEVEIQGAVRTRSFIDRVGNERRGVEINLDSDKARVKILKPAIAEDYFAGYEPGV